MHSFVTHERLYFILVLLLYAVFVFSLAASRNYLGYGVETDFVGSYAPDARHVLSGEPLESHFHPPAYPILLAFSYVVFGDWMRAGLVISVLSGFVVLYTAYTFFQQLCGRAAAWGAVLGLFGSSLFLRYSILATTDVFFLALFSSSCLLALRATSAGSRPLWAMCGALIGLSLMTRTNGISLLALLLMPFASSGALRSSLRDVGAVALGLAAVILLFVAYAAHTGSNLWPSQTYITLAMTYFTEEPIASEGMVEAETRFGGLVDVLLYEPTTIIKEYIRDIYLLFSENLGKIVMVPLAFLFPAGLLVLVGRFPNAVLLVFLGNIITQVLLVNFKAFDARFYLFLIPWIGASVSQIILLLHEVDWPPLGRRLVTGLLATGILLAVGGAFAQAARIVRNEGAELAEVVPRVRAQIPEGAKIVARKPHLAFYTGGTPLYLPDLGALANLRDHLASVASDGPVFLFYGAAERDRRPQYVALSDPSKRPHWLEVAQASGRGEWVLYRFGAPTPRANLNDER